LELRSQDFKVCDVKFAIYIALYNFDVRIADEDFQLEITEMQCDRILKQKFSEVSMSSFHFYLPLNLL
jgi:hypothetical protein